MSVIAVILSAALVCSTGRASPEADTLASALSEAEAAVSDGRLDDASEALGRAYAVSNDPRHLYARGQIERTAGRCAVAIVLWESFLDTGPSANATAAAERSIAACKQEVEASAPPAPASPTSAAPTTATPDQERSPPPTVDHGSGAPASDRPDQPMTSPWFRDPLGWTLVGVGVAGLAVGGTFVGLAYNANDGSTDAGSDVAFADERDRAQRREIIGTVGFALGAAAIIGGTIRLAVLRAKRRRPEVGLSPSGITVRGRF